jgi:predicted phosphoribosyltransferase/dienelactone hydrolase
MASHRVQHATPGDPPSASLRFADRRDAGRRLAQRLERFRGADVIVVGMARGGVPVAAEVAEALGAPLDVVLVRKVGAPDNPEYAIGALAEGGVEVLSARAVETLGLSERELRRLVDRHHAELDARLARYRGGTPPLDVAGRTVLLVDDGLATGRSARAAARSLRRRGAGRIVLAVPVGARSSVDELRDCVDDVVCVEAPEDLWAVGYWYRDFASTADEEVTTLLARLRDPATDPVDREVVIEAGEGVMLDGTLTLPAAPAGVVAFAHGSGSSRFSPRNRAVAAALQRAGIATLLFDLLSAREERERANVFDIALLARRLVCATRRLQDDADTRDLPLGYFGASTGAAAALIAAAELGTDVRAVVSRGGRPDLAIPRLPAVAAPTLLVVGGDDLQVLELNRRALEHLRCEKRLEVVPGATHLFEEPGTLAEVARLGAAWFGEHFGAAPPSAR